MDRELFEHHLTYPLGRGHAPAGGASGVAGTRSCGDVIRFTLALDAAGTHVADAGYEVDGCGAAIAAGSAAVELVRGRTLVDAARISVAEVDAALGGLSPAKLHAAELAADALARALGGAARASAQLPPPAGDGARTRTLVAMSGGVDSAVAALLSAQDGSEVLAVTLELWADEQNDEERSCCSAQAVRVARGLAHRMGIPHLTLDLRHEFRAGVVDPFLEGHAEGRTPNPCVSCNGHVRLDAMLELADRLGAAHLATGHYARVTEHEDAAGPLLRVAADPAKDQTYMLAALAPASLARLRFPLGALEKPQVRALAAEAALPVASKPDSQDLCFLAGTSRNAFLIRHGEMEEQPGEIVDRRGRVLGRHRGYHGFTVGQRKGLGVSGREPLYVIATDPRHNRVVAGTRDELRTSRVPIRGVRLHRDGARVDGVKLRYHAPPLPARLRDDPAAGTHRHAVLELGEPIDGAAPGQLACLMDGDVVVGWGTIVADPERLALPAPGSAPRAAVLTPVA